ncbi:hypothetical protein [Tropicimonas aquimaris]|uniref:Uncharacterized protein n=1 Tax=Tropicimonas aquimaris TaxID=914152 RepID=A0ABW3IRG2_9RHOB
MIFIRFALCLLLVAWSGPALAHSPYYQSGETVELPGFGVVKFRVLRGDGLYITDPRAIVAVDAEGRLLAVSPISFSMKTICRTSEGTRSCIGYNAHEGLVYTPDLTAFASTVMLEENGRPKTDPRRLGNPYGFTMHEAGLIERLVLDARKLVWEFPITIVSILWFAVMFAPLFAFWREALNSEDTEEVIQPPQLLPLWASAVAMPIYLWFINPGSPYLMVVYITSGAALGNRLSRLRPPRWLALSLKGIGFVLMALMLVLAGPLFVQPFIVALIAGLLIAPFMRRLILRRRSSG